MGKKNHGQNFGGGKEVFKITVALYTLTQKENRADLVWTLERAFYVNSREEALRLFLLRMYFNLAQSSSNCAPPKVLKAIFRALLHCVLLLQTSCGRMCFSFHVTPWN